jgi:lipoprotein-anchoring transpeptidase ErfK/SrfK
VIAAVAALEPGELISYGELAEEIGRPGSGQAVANVLRCAPGLPWWRVVPADGRLYCRHRCSRPRAIGSTSTAASTRTADGRARARVWFHQAVGLAVEPVSTRRRALLGLVLAGLVLVAALAAIVVHDDGSQPVVAATTTTTEPPTTTTVPPTEVPASTDLASPKGEIPTYSSPDGTEIGTVGFWYGYPVTTPIVQEARGGEWLRIMMPERPNGLTAWVKAEQVTRSTTPWRMVLKLSETRVYVYKDGYEAWSAPVGIGRDHTRTPTGRFFVAVSEQPGPAGYGPVVLDLNAHSEDIESWDGMGDAISAFHGPFGAEELLRAGGGKVSNGCIRMLPEDQIKMADITVGTPVDILP